MQVFTCNRADVLCLCLSADERSVFASGVEPSVVQFEFLDIKKSKKRKQLDKTGGDGTNKLRHWVQTTIRSQHSHDVRALVCTGNHLLSAGKQ